MSTFDSAITQVLHDEGHNLVQRFNEAGQEIEYSRFGVSLVWLANVIHGKRLDEVGPIAEKRCRDMITEMTIEDACYVYRKYAWEANQFGLIADQDLANKVFDIGTNVGYGTGVRLLQAACKACGRPVKVDGKLGAKTAAAVNSGDAGSLLDAFKGAALAYYTDICRKNKDLVGFLPAYKVRVNR